MDPRPGTAFADLVVGSHRLKLLRDGEQALPAMLAAIAAARSTVCLETYILRDDRTGRRFGEALAERARAGVQVNLLYDAWGSSVSDGFRIALQKAGVRTLAYRPVQLAGRQRALAARLWRRDHRKSLVVDGAIAFTGGMNIADDYAPLDEGGKGWRDTQLALEGPAVRELEFFFLQTWRRERGATLDELRYTREGGRRPDPLVTVVTNDLRHGRLGIARDYRIAIRAARRRIWITNAYFLPTLRVISLLERAARRGIDVRVIVAGKTDVPAVLLAARSIYGRLLAAGVRIYEYVERVLHAKTAVIDDDWSTVGSSNLDPQSLRMNLEVNALIRDARFASAMDEMFRQDLASSVEMTLERYGRRGLWDRAVSWGAYLFKDYL